MGRVMESKETKYFSSVDINYSSVGEIGATFANYLIKLYVGCQLIEWLVAGEFITLLLQKSFLILMFGFHLKSNRYMWQKMDTEAAYGLLVELGYLVPDILFMSLMNIYYSVITCAVRFSFIGFSTPTTNGTNNNKENIVHIVVSSEAKMSQGKTLVQVAHAASASLSFRTVQAAFWHGLRADKAKPTYLIFKTKGDNSLEKIVEKLNQHGLKNQLISDAGRTQIAPGTKTCIVFETDVTNSLFPDMYVTM